MPMFVTAREPRPEDFGVTGSQVEQAPELRLPRARPVVLVVLYLMVFAILFAVILTISGSLSAALTFTVILGAAASIVLIPLLLCIACASERAETRWLCRKFPALESCLAYREALEAYHRLTEPRRGDPDEPRSWTLLDLPAFTLGVERRLTEAGETVIPVRSRVAAGYDHEVPIGEDRVLVRCEPGDRPVDIGVGRELMGCLDETGADRAVVVTAAPVTAELEAYLEGRPLSVTDPVQLSIRG
jgi:hypothetical protein